MSFNVGGCVYNRPSVDDRANGGGWQLGGLLPAGPAEPAQPAASAAVGSNIRGGAVLVRAAA
jgi:hypothetical protein